MKNIIFLAVILFCFSCNSNNKSSTKQQKATPNKEISIEQSIPVFPSFTPTYKIIEIRDLSYADIIRKEVRVSLPRNLNKDDILFNFRVISTEEYNKNKFNAITVFAFHENESVNQAYTVAMYEFCPYGDWSRSDKKVPLSEYGEKIEIKKSYFEEATNKWGVPFSKRNEIRGELQDLQVKATEDADKKYPLTSRSITKADIKRNDKYRTKILSKYKRDLAKKYKISSAVLDSIAWENVFK